jgi:predicted metalloprotease with PDZ domain
MNKKNGKVWMRIVVLLLLVLSLQWGQSGVLGLPFGAGRVEAQTAGRPLEISYRLAFPQPHTHLYEVTLTIGQVARGELDVSMPTWTPGSYLQREFARHVQDFAASDGNGQPLRWTKVDKATWRVMSGASAGSLRTVKVFYRVYANELATQTSHLDADHAYFNGTSIFMYVPGAKDQPHRLKFDPPAGWQVTTPLGLAPEADGYFTAPNYDVLADSPTEIGNHKLLTFTVRNKVHRVSIYGRFNFDEKRLTDDLAKIVEENAKLFGSLPYEHYQFLIAVQPGLGGGTEHINSNISMTSPEAFTSEAGYRRFLGLESHEFFHTWNVKRLRPVALGPFDYQRENYTRGLWVAEGITSYYGDLILRRAGMISSGEYLGGLAGLLAGYEAQPGRLKQSAEVSSFDTWIEQYRPDEHSINTAMSYYTKGELLGLVLDLEIRSRTKGARSLDDVMRRLMENHGLPKPGFTDAQLKATFEEVAGGDLTDFWNRYVAGVEELDFEAWLRKVGLSLQKSWQLGTPYANSRQEKPGTLGIRFRPAAAQSDRVVISNVLAGLPGYEGGLNSGDELVSIDGLRIDAGNAGRRINELRAGQRVTVTVFRREQLRTFELTAAVKPFDRYQITELRDAGVEQVNLRRQWLAEK